jgi:hypothetical protein
VKGDLESLRAEQALEEYLLADEQRRLQSQVRAAKWNM